MKQTAVEWLVEELTETKFLWLSDKPEMLNLIKIINQAKEMEKEQIVEAFLDDLTPNKQNIKEAEKYYNETYGRTI